ncbi:hypothetical protein MNBD_GAMMA20-477 [hydrothermal vent metagenome]|uniref:Uncharacterized protein n=1 Tax=hydrothermal vent metagenome TaxID=652676 RepID=A0A3B1ABT1_9ZZZZ
MIVLRSTVLFLLTLSLASATEIDPPQTKQALRQLLGDIDKHEQHNNRQRAVLQRIEQQMECNWALIRSYEICTQLYRQDEPQKHLACVNTAKENTTRCLSNTTDQP